MPELSILYSKSLIQIFRLYQAKICPILKADSGISVKEFVFCLQIPYFVQLFDLSIVFDLLEEFVDKMHFTLLGLCVGGLWFCELAKIQL